MTATREDARPRILVLSLDFDGCIFNPKYKYSANQTENIARLIEANQLFINHVLNEINGGNYDRVIFMVGSNRQSVDVDMANSYNKGSAYPALRDLCAEIQKSTKVPCEYDGYLLSDTYGRQPHGDNFLHWLEKKAYSFSRFVWEESKRLLLYAQIHKISSENKNADITFKFYDDRKDILGGVYEFANVEKILLPKNSKLQFYRYNGKELNAYGSEIQPEGVMDDLYEKNVRLAASYFGYDRKTKYVPFFDSTNPGITLEHDFLRRFKNERKLKIKDISYELEYEMMRLKQNPRYCDTDWQDFLNKLQDLKKKFG